MIDWLETVLTTSRPADLLRLVAVPVFGWAAYRDVQTRRVPNRTWLPLALLGAALLVWEVWAVSSGQSLGTIYTAQDRELFFLRVALSLGMVGSIGYLFYWFGGFGGADAKALIVLTVLFPTFPTYYFPEFTLPWAGPTGVGVFSLTILSNTVLVGVVFPVFIALRNALSGHVAKVMVVGKPVRTADVTDEYGSLLQTPEGFTRRGLDLDALRMYLRWRGCTLADVLADPGRLRDPDSLPDETNPPGDGSIPRNDGAADVEGDPDVATDGGADEEIEGTVDEDAKNLDEDTKNLDENGEPADDPWGAAAFLDDIEGTAYGTTPEGLREGLDVLVAEDVVWISPGMPFIVPMFAGLLVSLLYGDLLADLMSMLV